MKAALLGLVALFAVGCVSPAAKPTDVAVAPVAKLTADEQAQTALENAMGMWGDAVGYAPVVDHIRFREPDSDEDRVAALFDAETSTLILVPVRIGDDQRRWNTIVGHELGHGLGLAHVEDPAALMYVQPNTDACVHAADGVEVRRVLGIVARTTCGDARP